ncbi:Bacterial regulatory protein, arsR family [Leptolyngbyaceae cyanobacterium JSC-12]|nr:Bacterial regulatory protein, arsR family [Leptolyngbyaceae cyanobacterium JSC-12]
MDWITNLKRLEEIADRFRMMSDPTRLHILTVLGEQELSVQDICDRTKLKHTTWQVTEVEKTIANQLGRRACKICSFVCP